VEISNTILKCDGVGQSKTWLHWS